MKTYRYITMRISRHRRCHFQLRSLAYTILLISICAIGYNLLTRFTDASTDWTEFRKTRYQAAQNRPPRDGPGEDGAAVKLTPKEQIMADRLFTNASFNVFASDKVALDRSIPDTRRKE